MQPINRRATESVPSRVEHWAATRTFHHRAFPPQLVAKERKATISVCLPARNEEATIGRILDDLMPLIGGGVIDEVVVLDDSQDATPAIASQRGATVYSQSSLCPELGPVDGKGDAMWRALSVLEGDVICFLDADSELFGPHYASALAGTVALEESIKLAKACYRRPFRNGAEIRPTGGGRVTELTARPLVRALYPELAGFAQPIAGELAAERALLMDMPFFCGYAVDLPLLIDAWKIVGLDGLAQVDLDVRQNRHRPLAELASLADAVVGGVLTRAQAEGRFSGEFVSMGLRERPPMSTYQSLRSFN